MRPRETGEMALWLRALAALLDDLSSVPNTHIRKLSVTSAAGELMPPPPPQTAHREAEAKISRRYSEG